MHTSRKFRFYPKTFWGQWVWEKKNWGYAIFVSYLSCLLIFNILGNYGRGVAFMIPTHTPHPSLIINYLFLSVCCTELGLKQVPFTKLNDFEVDFIFFSEFLFTCWDKMCKHVNFSSLRNVPMKKWHNRKIGMTDGSRWKLVLVTIFPRPIPDLLSLNFFTLITGMWPNSNISIITAISL